MKKDKFLNTSLPVSSQIRNILQSNLEVVSSASGGRSHTWICELSIGKAVELIMEIVENNVKEIKI
jgi:hypothetical protein